MSVIILQSQSNNFAISNSILYSRDVQHVEGGGEDVHHPQRQQGDAGHEGGVLGHKH